MCVIIPQNVYWLLPTDLDPFVIHFNSKAIVTKAVDSQHFLGKSSLIGEVFRSSTNPVLIPKSPNVTAYTDSLTQLVFNPPIHTLNCIFPILAQQKQW